MSAPLHVVPSLNTGTGGPAVSVPKLADAVSTAGFRSTVITHNYPELVCCPRNKFSKYPPAKPGALSCEPLKAAIRGR